MLNGNSSGWNSILGHDLGRVKRKREKNARGKCVRYSSDCVRREVKSSKSIKMRFNGRKSRKL